MPFLLPRSLVCPAPSTQGHLTAAALIGGTYNFGQGVAVDHKRAMTAYKIGAEGGNDICQHQLGYMLQYGVGIDVDYEQALVWYEKAAAQDEPEAVGELGFMAACGQAQQPSWRRAREHWQRAIDLGEQQAQVEMQGLREEIQKVSRSHAGNHPGLTSPPPPPPLSTPPS